MIAAGTSLTAASSVVILRLLQGLEVVTMPTEL
jgi:hypothetical protein